MDKQDDSGAACQGFPHCFCFPAPDCRILDGLVNLKPWPSRDHFSACSEFVSG